MYSRAGRIADSVGDQLRLLVGHLVARLGNDSDMCEILVLRFTAPELDAPEYSLFVDCAWRLERNGEVLAGSADGDPNQGRAGGLIGRALTGADISVPGLDAVLLFDGGFILHLFATRNDLSEEEGEFTHWRLYGPGRYYLGLGPGLSYRLDGGN